MPIHADTSPNIKWKLPEGKPAFFMYPVFTNEILATIKQTISEQAVWGPGSELKANAVPYHTILGRWHTEIEFPPPVWEYLETLGKEKWGISDLKLKIVWVARYQQYKGITPYIWEHMDQPATQYTADICIESPGVPSWGLSIDGERFEEQENSGIFFMGQQQVHTRPRYPVDDENAYITVLFANYATPDHWIYDIDCYSEEGNHQYAEAMKKYKLDGDIRYYEYKGHGPYFNDLPEGNYECVGCSQCTVVGKDFIEDLEGYIRP